MRFMLLIGSGTDSKAGARSHDRRVLEEVSKFGEELDRAGILIGGGGLQPLAPAIRFEFSDGWPTPVDARSVDSPWAVLGCWIIRVASRDEAVEWAMLAPLRTGRVEVRQIMDSAHADEDDLAAQSWASRQGVTSG